MIAHDSPSLFEALPGSWFALGCG